MNEMYEDMEIDDLNVDEKVKEALKKSGFKYVRQLENKDIRRIYEVVILGNKYVEELEEELYLLGVELEDEHDYTISKFEQWRKDNAAKVLPKEKFQNTEEKESNKDSEGKDKNNEVSNDVDKGER